jgi:hypothetical protein
VLDTGIRWGHEEFANDPDARSRIICGFDAFNFYHEPEDWNNGCYDGVGHGTHMAAIIGGSVYVRYYIFQFVSRHDRHLIIRQIFFCIGRCKRRSVG